MPHRSSKPLFTCPYVSHKNTSINKSSSSCDTDMESPGGSELNLGGSVSGRGPNRDHRRGLLLLSEKSRRYAATLSPHITTVTILTRGLFRRQAAHLFLIVGGSFGSRVSSGSYLHGPPGNFHTMQFRLLLLAASQLHGGEMPGWLGSGSLHRSRMATRPGVELA